MSTKKKKSNNLGCEAEGGDRRWKRKKTKKKKKICGEDRKFNFGYVDFDAIVDS